LKYENETERESFVRVFQPENVQRSLTGKYHGDLRDEKRVFETNGAVVEKFFRNGGKGDYEAISRSTGVAAKLLYGIISALECRNLVFRDAKGVWRGVSSKQH